MNNPRCNFCASTHPSVHIGVMFGDFLPFGTGSGDSIVPRVDDGSTGVIQLGTDVVISGSHQNRLYVRHIYTFSFYFLKIIITMILRSTPMV